MILNYVVGKAWRPTNRWMDESDSFSFGQKREPRLPTDRPPTRAMRSAALAKRGSSLLHTACAPHHSSNFVNGNPFFTLLFSYYQLSYSLLSVFYSFLVSLSMLSCSMGSWTWHVSDLFKHLSRKLPPPHLIISSWVEFEIK